MISKRMEREICATSDPGHLKSFCGAVDATIQQGSANQILESLDEEMWDQEWGQIVGVGLGSHLV